MKIFLILTAFIVTTVLFLLNKDKKDKLLPFIIINTYTIKLYIENYINWLDKILQIIIITGIIIYFIQKLLSNNKVNLNSNYRRKVKRTSYDKIKLNKLIIVFFSIVIINGLYNVIFNRNIDTNYIGAIVNLGYIFFIIEYLINTINNKQYLNKIFKFTSINYILYIIMAIYDIYILNFQRIGHDINPNYYSLNLILLLLFIIYSNKDKKNIINIIATIVGIGIIVFTKSSTAIISIIALIFIYMSSIIKLKNKYIIIYILFIVITLIYMGMIVMYNFENGNVLVDLVVKKDDPTRIYVWKEAFNSIKSNILMGEYYGTYRVFFNKFNYVTHNDFIKIAVELGIFTLIYIYRYIYLIIKKISEYNIKDLNFLFSFIMIILIYSLTHNNMNNMFFWLAIILPTIDIYKEEFLIDEKSVK